MPVLDLPPVNYAEEASLVYELDHAPPASGSDGQELFRQYQNAYMHSQDRLSSIIGYVAEEESLRHVPFKKVGTIKVRFKAAIPMKPRTIDVEPDETE